MLLGLEFLVADKIVRTVIIDHSMVGAVASLYADYAIDAIAITVIFVINAIISFVQEFKTAQSLAALKDISAPSAFVRRDGSWQSIPAADLIPGEILRLNIGDIVAADIQLLGPHTL